jgi:hypothetical protein
MAGQPFVLLEEQTREELFGWVFFYQSEASRLANSATSFSAMRPSWCSAIRATSV